MDFKRESRSFPGTGAAGLYPGRPIWLYPAPPGDAALIKAFTVLATKRNSDPGWIFWYSPKKENVTKLSTKKKRPRFLFNPKENIQRWNLPSTDWKIMV